MPQANQTEIRGAPAEEEAQGTVLFPLEVTATADGPGTVAPADGFNGAQMIEIQKSGAGTCTATIEGSYDGTTWYAAGYQQVDGVATPARAAAGLAIGAGTVNHVYQVLDRYPQLRLRISGTAGAIALSANLYAVPL